jgi:sulfate adenylyltransferase subunit 1
VYHLVDISTLSPVAPSGPVGVNSIVRASLALQQPLAYDPYRVNRGTGAFILIDEATHHTVAAGMLE